MKRILLLLIVVFQWSCSNKDDFIEGQFVMSVTSDHPIWEVWMQGIDADQKETVKSKYIEAINKTTYVFVKDDTYHAYLFAPNIAINSPEKNSVDLIKKKVEGNTIYINEDEDVYFRFDGTNAYVMPGGKLQYEILLIKK